MSWIKALHFAVACLLGIFASNAQDTQDPSACEADGSNESCSLPREGRRCSRSGCLFLGEKDWMEPGDRLLVNEDGDANVFATLTTDGDLVVMDTARGDGESTIIWQKQGSDGQLQVDREGNAGVRLTLLADGLSASIGDNRLWAIHFLSANNPVKLRLQNTGELFITRYGEQLWQSGAVREQVGGPAPAPPTVNQCRVHLTCEVCIADSSCAWCLSRRKCSPDEANYCDSSGDHVSPRVKFQGQPTSCPSKEEKEADVLRRHAAKQAAKEEQSRLAEDAMEAEASQGENVSEGDKSDIKARKLKRELERRARWGEEGRGAAMPYEVLGVSRGATASEIRRAYRKLSVLLHPDKNPTNSDLAGKAFADLGIAYGLIGSPDKRAAFDESGGTGFEESWKKQNWRGDEDFFFGSALVATLTLNLWEARLVGKSIWLIDLYAAWCPHCRTFVPAFEQVAKLLDEGDAGVETGAVNCVKQKVICSEYVGVKSYPTIVLLNRESGMMQRFPKERNSRDPAAIVEWARNVASEWKYLLTHGQVTMATAATFEGVLNTTDMVVALFTDGLDCMPCKTAKTNLMRLSASMAELPVTAVVIDCEQPENKELCYTEHGLPPSPHRPVLKGWPTLKELGGPRGPGELLFDVTVLESHIALEFLERALRLALSAQVAHSDALTTGKRSDYDKEEDEKDDEPTGGGDNGERPQRRFDEPQLSWNERPALMWDGPDDHQAKPVPIDTWRGPRFEHTQIGR